MSFCEISLIHFDELNSELYIVLSDAILMGGSDRTNSSFKFMSSELGFTGHFHNSIWSSHFNLEISSW